MDVAFALTSCKLRQPYMSFKVTDLGLLLRVAIKKKKIKVTHIMQKQCIKNKRVADRFLD